MHDEKKPIEKKSKKSLYLKIAAAFVALLIIVPIGLNIYLKRKLPDLINEKTPYKVTLKEFSLDLFSGNLHVKDVVIDTKNPKDTTVTFIKGTIKELEVNDLGVFRILFSKAYHADNLTVKSPNLNFKIAKVKKEKKPKKLDFNLENIFVSDGNITALDHENKPVFNGKNINIDLQDIHLNEDKAKIPITFSKFLVNASDLVFTINDFYRITASEINAKNKVFQLKKMHLFPIKNIKEHNAKSVIELRSELLLADNFTINKDSLYIENTIINQPNLSITETGKNITKVDKKDIDLKVDLKKVKINKGQLLVKDANQSKKTEIKAFNIDLNGIVLDKNTVKKKLPFRFDSHSVDLSGVYIKASAQQEITIGHIFTNNKNIKIDSLKLNPLGSPSQLNLWRGEVSQVLISDNNSKVSEKGVALNARQIKVVKPNITMLAPSSPKQKTIAKNKSELDVDFVIGSVLVENGEFYQIKNGKRNIALGQLDAVFNSVTKHKNKKDKDLPFLVKSHKINIGNIHMDAGKHYDLYVKNINNTGKNTVVKNIHFKPKYSRKAFSKVIAQQEDLYDVTVRELNVLDQNELFGYQGEINLKKVSLDGIKASIYHDLEPPNDDKFRILFSEKLRNIATPLFVDEVAIKNSYISYEEHAVNNNKPGLFFMDQFNASIKNVGNGKIKDKPTMVKVVANFNVFGTATSKVNWDFDVLNKMDDFKINGDISQLSADNVNLFVRPYLNIEIDGKINYLRFNYYGNKNGIKGQFRLNYNDIYVNFINKKTGENKKVLSKAVNAFIRNDSKENQKPVNIDKKRDPERSFFNMLWQGIMEGLKKTLV